MHDLNDHLHLKTVCWMWWNPFMLAFFVINLGRNNHKWALSYTRLRTPCLDGWWVRDANVYLFAFHHHRLILKHVVFVLFAEVLTYLSLRFLLTFKYNRRKQKFATQHLKMTSDLFFHRVTIERLKITLWFTLFEAHWDLKDKTFCTKCSSDYVTVSETSFRQRDQVGAASRDLS